jgi:hypothetical protein
MLDILWRFSIVLTLGELNLGHCIAGYSNVFPLNIVSPESFTRHDLPALLATYFVGDHMETALSRVQFYVFSGGSPVTVDGDS